MLYFVLFLTFRLVQEEYWLYFLQKYSNSSLGGPRGRVVKVADFIIALDHSIISPLWLVWVRAPHGSQVRQVKFYLRVCQVVFPGVLPFSPHLLIGSSRYEWNNLERDVKLNEKKKFFSTLRRHKIAFVSKTGHHLRCHQNILLIVLF